MEKAKIDARKTVSILAGRKAKVWIAGLEFGIYTGLSFYNSNLKPYINHSLCSFWIARYPSNVIMDVSKDPQCSKKPVIKNPLEGWQYTSRGQVPGIKGNVDMNLWYGKYKEEITNSTENPYPVPKRLLCLKYPQLYGNDIKWIQHHLIRLGFLSVKNGKGKSNVDGIFGKDTDKALRMAQAHFDITVDGIAGPITINALQ